MSLATEVHGGVTFAVRVIPNARKSEVAGLEGNSVKIRLTAHPVDGAANAALIDFLADLLSVRKSSIEIWRGQSSRNKRIHVAGLSAAEVEQRLRLRAGLQ